MGRSEQVIPVILAGEPGGGLPWPRWWRGTRASMLHDQCDLIEGLAERRAEIGPVETAICRSDQAIAVAGLGDRQAELAQYRPHYENLLAEFRAAKAPTHDLAEAVSHAASGYARLLPPTAEGAPGGLRTHGASGASSCPSGR